MHGVKRLTGFCADMSKFKTKWAVSPLRPAPVFQQLICVVAFLLLSPSVLLCLVHGQEQRCFYGDYSSGNLLDQRVQLVDSKESLETALRGKKVTKKQS